MLKIDVSSTYMLSDHAMRNLGLMQAAYFIGRHSSGPLGDVDAHLYVEFEGGRIGLTRLLHAVSRLGAMHPLTRLRVSADGMQSVAPETDLRLEIEDLRGREQPEIEALLAAKRHAWSHRGVDLAAGQAMRFGASLLPDDRIRLHVDASMVAIDPPSFRLVMEDLAVLCDEPLGTPAGAPSYFDWLDRAAADSDLRAQHRRDKRWWASQLDRIPPAPILPPADGPSRRPESDRLAVQLDATARTALARLARTERITLASLTLGLFAAVLGRRTGDARFRLNVPMFWRPPVVGDVDRIVGEFATVLVLSVDLDGVPTLSALCRQVSERMGDALAHSAYPGVSVMRDLSRHRGSAQAAPVVFTAALDLPGGDLFSERVRAVFGRMIWTISQGPQVALDAQIAAVEGGILVNWDIRRDALPPDWVDGLFDDYVRLLRAAADRPALLREAWSPPRAASGVAAPRIDMPAPGARKLNALQQAYLLGRRDDLPLGGVAMQEFRDYRGRLDPALLRRRLEAMVARHESLRTRIDADRLVSQVTGSARSSICRSRSNSSTRSTRLS